MGKVLFNLYFAPPSLQIIAENKNERKNMKKLLVIGAVLLVAFVGVRVKQASDLAAYAAVNNCTWVATGSAYGDDRDWVCK